MLFYYKIKKIILILIMNNYSNLVLGIDLGTINSCSAIIINDKLEVTFDLVSQK